MDYQVEQIIEHFQLVSHPEGGYYRQHYHSQEFIHEECLPIRFSGERYYSTSIYYLLSGTDFSAFHRIKSDEGWHFYYGGSLNLYLIDSEGNFELVTLGSNLLNGEEFQYVVKAGTWFAAQPANPDRFSLLGCTVAPGFDYADFELAKVDELLAAFPQHEELIRRYCR